MMADVLVAASPCADTMIGRHRETMNMDRMNSSFFFMELFFGVGFDNGWSIIIQGTKNQDINQL